MGIRRLGSDAVGNLPARYGWTSFHMAGQLRNTSLGPTTIWHFGDSRNSWWVALLTFGEGWHNNHHAFPRLLDTV